LGGEGAAERLDQPGAAALVEVGAAGAAAVMLGVEALEKARAPTVVARRGACVAAAVVPVEAGLQTVEQAGAVAFVTPAGGTAAATAAVTGGGRRSDMSRGRRRRGRRRRGAGGGVAGPKR